MFLRIQFLLCVFVFGLFWFTPSSVSQALYSSEEIHCIAEAIYQSECGGKEAALISWNENESFPSLGIGHFIWVPENRNEKFQSSFPALIDFMVAKGVVIPDDLRFIREKSPPWKNRSEFESLKKSNRLSGLKDFLIRTKDLQAEFILERTYKFIDQVASDQLISGNDRVRAELKALIQTEKGRYALMDYINFKGEGTMASESYRGKGWGAIQVLNRMRRIRREDAVERFAQSAVEVLKRRVQNSDRFEVESKWLPGWMNRVNGYQYFECHPITPTIKGNLS